MKALPVVDVELGLLPRAEDQAEARADDRIVTLAGVGEAVALDIDVDVVRAEAGDRTQPARPAHLEVGVDPADPLIDRVGANRPFGARSNLAVLRAEEPVVDRVELELRSDTPLDATAVPVAIPTLLEARSDDRAIVEL